VIRAFQWDIARQVERIDWLLAQLPRYADWGYQELYLHLEDAIEYPSLPAVARPDAYTYRQMERLVRTATRAGIKVVPIVNLLGHTQYLIKVPELRDLNELRAPDGSPLERGQVCPLHPGILDVAEKLLRDVAPFCTAGKVHVGLDESFHLGRHPRSRREVARIGLPAHFARYVGRLERLVTSRGLQMGLWADMLYFLPEAIEQLPAGIAVYEWYYYAFTRRPRVELFNFAESNVGERLRARGLDYWGCPMNGAFRFEPMPHFHDRLDNMRSWWRRAAQLDAAGFLVTGWEPNRLALELTTAIDAAAASLWLDSENLSPQQMLQRGFERVFGRGHSSREAARLALASDRYPFSGYPRWATNERWEVASRRESIAPYRREEKFFRGLVERGTRAKAPEPLQASLEFRHYLAERDVVLRRRAAGGAAEELSTTRGLISAQRMWRTTRDPRVRGPNETLVHADAARAKQLPDRRWQLCYQVENFAPACQWVGVEQQAVDGTWRLLQSCHTIEFQTRAARPRGGLIREHAAPFDWNGAANSPPRLRFVLRGVGQVRLREVELVSAAKRRIRAKLNRHQLGRPAPRRGLPALDWTVNTDSILVRIIKPTAGKR
jgi:hypothetical protein